MEIRNEWTPANLSFEERLMAIHRSRYFRLPFVFFNVEN